MQIYWQREWQRIRRVSSNLIRHQWVRLRHRDGTTPPIFANSFPKSGTYMLSRCLELMPSIVAYHRGVWLAHAGKMRPSARRAQLQQLPLGSYVSGHLAYLPEQVTVLRELGLRSVMILRDPRDVATSYYSFEMKYRWLPHYRYFNSLDSNEQRLMAMIQGD
ncbi:MAG: sulfotransferase domain-containing protein, partial [Candidatus Promineifilaceae bacterium]